MWSFMLTWLHKNRPQTQNTSLPKGKEPHSLCWVYHRSLLYQTRFYLQPLFSHFINISISFFFFFDPITPFTFLLCFFNFYLPTFLPSMHLQSYTNWCLLPLLPTKRILPKSLRIKLNFFLI